MQLVFAEMSSKVELLFFQSLFTLAQSRGGLQTLKSPSLILLQLCNICTVSFSFHSLFTPYIWSLQNLITCSSPLYFYDAAYIKLTDVTEVQTDHFHICFMSFVHTKI